ncbi:MAG: cation:dicarboxylase symporter family transporter [Bacteroidetes bacterium]|nr:cation:dicarboxylase symporter family transporter [Bacteroidota bacterium]
MKKIALHWQVIIALLLGVVYAYIAVVFHWNEFTADFIEPFGKIFINVLKLIAVPLVLFSIISGIVNLKDINKLGRLGIKTLIIYLLTTFAAVSLGLVLVNLIKPGKHVDQQTRNEKRIEYELWRNAAGAKKLDDINFLTDANHASEVETVTKRLALETIDPEVQKKMIEAESNKSKGPLQPLVDVFPHNIFVSLADMQMLQIIFFAIFFGVILIILPVDQSKPMVDLVNSANFVFIRMVEIVMYTMPYFVFALMAGTLVKSAGNDLSRFQSTLSFLGNYSLVVIIGLVIMAYFFYPALIAFFAKHMSVPRFLKGISKAQLTAFSTSSSVATLPVTMDCVNNKLDVPEATTSFVLPIGATVNMDGTSLYQAVAVVALAQLHMVDLDIVQQLTIVLTATLASIGAAAVPSAGLVLMILVLESVGLNPAWIAIIFPVDRILDMCRTVVNVTGDATVSVLVSGSEAKN